MLGVGIALLIAYLGLMAAVMQLRFVYWFAILLLTVAFSKLLVSIGSAPPRIGIVGISSAAPSLSSPSVLMLVLASLGVILGFRLHGWMWVSPGFAGLAVGALFFWPQSPNVAAGVFHIGVCLLAWVVANWFGWHAVESKDITRGLAIVLLAFVAFQLGLCLVQLITGSTLHGRTEGSFIHPSVLGKVVLIIFILTLPMTQVADRITARAATWATALGGLATVTTASRANIVGVFGMLAVWLLITKVKRGVRRRAIAIAVVIGGATLPMASTLVARFTTDLEGGDRPALWDAGMRVISEHIWTGTGPNNYVETARTTESIVAATGYPTHNSMALVIAELGIVVAVLILLPLLRTGYVAVASTQVRSIYLRQTSQVALIGLFAVAFVSWTGWGFLQMPVFLLLYFVFGFSHGQLARANHGFGNSDGDIGTQFHFGSANAPAKVGALKSFF